jgi:VanZ family protein
VNARLILAARTLEDPAARRPVRWLFLGYSLVLIVLTLWPALKVPEIVHRSDLVAHLSFFGAFTTLAIASGFFGPVFSRRNISLAWIACAAFAGIDEGLQAIPALNRTCAWDDMAANTMGTLAAALLMALWGSLARD